jgi:hypothetical protein
MPQKEIGPYNAAVHLFEHDYNDRIRFWYGVADVAVTVSEFHEAANRAGLSAEPGSMHQPANFNMRIDLPDGRTGLARHFTSDWEEGMDTEHYTEIAFVCVSNLA